MMWSPLLLATLASHALSAAVPATRDVPEADFDAIIVGGGPSGLSALSGLARVRRNVLLIDSGEYRNNPTRHVHDLLGFDGVTPAYYRWAAREQLSFYDTAKLTNGTVTKIEPKQDPNSNNTLFTVTTSSPSNETVVQTARKIVLATGLRDLLPETPGIRENWGKGIYWCPWCDGHEHKDQGLGLLTTIDGVAGLVREIQSLNTDVYAFINGTDTPENRALAEESFPRWESYLALKNITLFNSSISEVKRLKTAEPTDPSLPTAPEFDLFSVEFEDGSDPVERAAFLTDYEDEQLSSVGPDLGVRLDGGRLAADSTRGLQTNIPGVYAIGDANADNVTNVPHALFSGKRTAVFLHVQLERENAEVEIDEYEASHPQKREEVHKSIWERMNGRPDEDLLYAGQYDG